MPSRSRRTGTTVDAGRCRTTDVESCGEFADSDGEDGENVRRPGAGPAGAARGGGPARESACRSITVASLVGTESDIRRAPTAGQPCVRSDGRRVAQGGDPMRSMRADSTAAVGARSRWMRCCSRRTACSGSHARGRRLAQPSSRARAASPPRRPPADAAATDVPVARPTIEPLLRQASTAVFNADRRLIDRGRSQRPGGDQRPRPRRSTAARGRPRANLDQRARCAAGPTALAVLSTDRCTACVEASRRHGPVA